MTAFPPTHSNVASRFNRHPLTAGRVIEGQAYVVTGEHGKMLTLNPAATVLWQLAKVGCTAAEAAEALVAEFEVDVDTALADAEGCLSDLVSRDVLVEASA